jgi:small-conductance mechanosensitive channel
MIASVILQSQTWALLVERVRGLVSIGGQVLVDWLLALLVVLIGWILARLLEAFTLHLLRALRFNQGVRGLLGGTTLAPAHEPAAFASWAVRWTVVVVTVMLALDVLGLNVTSGVGDRLVDTLPRVVTATIMLAAGLVLAWILGGVTSRLFEGAGLKGSRIRGQVVTAVLSGFAVLLALEQLGFAAQFVMALGVTAVGAAGIAVGLAFGLGCRDLARDFVVEYLRSLDDDKGQRPA